MDSSNSRRLNAYKRLLIQPEARMTATRTLYRLLVSGIISALFWWLASATSMPQWPRPAVEAQLAGRSLIITNRDTLHFKRLRLYLQSDELHKNSLPVQYRYRLLELAPGATDTLALRRFSHRSGATFPISARPTHLSFTTKVKGTKYHFHQPFNVDP